MTAGPDGVLRGFVACSDREVQDVVYMGDEAAGRVTLQEPVPPSAT